MPPFNPEYLSFEELENIAKEFKDGLEAIGIEAKKGTKLGDIFALVLELPERRKNIQSMPPQADIRNDWSNILAVRRLALKFVRLHKRAGFEVMVDHLKLLNEGRFAENRYDRSDPANKVFELLLALLAFEIGRDLILDAPTNAKSKPGIKKVDIRFTFQGIRWAIECKVPNGSPESVVNLFDKAMLQIEESDATLGCMAISARNLLLHDSFWPKAKDGTFVVWPSKDTPQMLIEQAVSEIKEAILDVRPSASWDAAFKGKKTLPNILGYFESVCAVMHNGRETIASYGLMAEMNLGSTPAPIPPLFEAMNLAMNDRY
jgi:hypothetical protein